MEYSGRGFSAESAEIEEKGERKAFHHSMEEKRNGSCQGGAWNQDRLVFQRKTGLRLPGNHRDVVPFFHSFLIPESNEPSDCLQTFGGCPRGHIPRCSASLLDAPHACIGGVDWWEGLETIASVCGRLRKKQRRRVPWITMKISGNMRKI